METDTSEFPQDGFLEQLGLSEGSGVQAAQGKDEETYLELSQDHPRVHCVCTLI